MFSLHPIKAFCALFSLIVFTACSSNAGMRIGNTVTLCCPGDYANYDSYAIEVEELPVFLRDYVVTEFDIAFQELGMVRNDSSGDIVVNLTYRHVSLDPEQQDIDPFTRIESMSTTIDYIANIDITMRERISGKAVWGGTISHVHSVSPGEYMHEEGAKPAFLKTFRDLLSEYPRSKH